jgi:hypothetical protein
LYPRGCRHDAAKIAECKQRIEMEAHAMSLICNGDAVSRGRGFLAVLLAALLALFVFCPDVATAQELKQIKLTEKHVQGFMAVSEDMTKLYNGTNPDRPDPKLEAQAEALVKKNGFGSLAEYDNVSMNISMIMSGIDPQSKKFTEPPEQIKKDIAAQVGPIGAGEAKERGPGAARGRAQGSKTHSVQGKHWAGVEVFR